MDRARIGPLGTWTFALDLQPVAAAQEAAAEIEELGYGAIWIPEVVAREAFVSSTLLLAGTSRIVVATGIATIWGRDPVTAACAHRTIESAFPQRFLLGLGVSHAPAVEGLRGHTYDKPLTAMRDYLDRMDRAPFLAYPPEHEPQRVLAALGPRMLALAAERSAGAHPYLVPPEHTAFAREHLGPDPLLCPEQKVVLQTDAIAAREVARLHLAPYLGLPNYANNLRRFGFTDEDLAAPGSDRLVDALVAWGDEDTIAERVRAHHDAGADHVCVQVLDADRRKLPLPELRRLAPALLGG